MRLLFTIFLASIALLCSSQGKVKQFKKLSCPEKKWVICHPFVAKKALRISNETLRVVDSVKAKNTLTLPESGGQIDAFRHGYWMCRLTEEIGRKRAIKLGNTHEKGNKIDFDKGKLEEGFLPDSVSVHMDLTNNLVGAFISINNTFKTEKDRIRTIVSAIQRGDFLIVKMDAKFNSLNLDGEIIENWQGSWVNDRVLVPSNEIHNNE